MWMTGKWPRREVGHKNRIKADNRWCNLREASRSQTMINSGLRSTNSSGATGVWLQGDKYRATIVRKHLGMFDTMEAAIGARRQAEQDCWCNKGSVI
jgi:HNH endonuclease